MRLIIVASFALLLGACSSGESRPPVDRQASRAPAKALAGGPPAMEPLRNEPVSPLPAARFDPQKMELGRQLYFDVALSGDNTVSCASCHAFEHGGAEPRAVSTGIRAQQGPINAPTVLNSAFNFVQFWDGRADSLEAQAAGPVANPLEMGSEWAQVIEELKENPEYVARFAALYPDGITQANVTNAIAEYERSLVTPSRFDLYLAGDRTALTEVEQRGYGAFKQFGCTSCHNGVNIGGGSFQKMGNRVEWFPTLGRELTDADYGRFNVTHDEAHRHQFKVPTLRNVALTGPYMHDGSQTRLEDVVRIMGHYQLGIDIPPARIEEIVAFLEALTGEIPATARMPGS